MIIEEQQKLIRLQNIKREALKNEIEIVNHKLKLKENMTHDLEQREKGVEEESEQY